MTAAVIGLAASYLVIALLLLSLNLRSAWRWPVKAGAILVTIAFVIGGFLALEAMLGCPTEATPPATFELHAAVVHEPDRATSSGGAIFLWVSPRDADGRSSAPPRAYALPYTRALHEQVARAQGGLKEGRPVEGAARLRPDQYRLGTRAVEVELYAARRALASLATQDRVSGHPAPLIPLAQDAAPAPRRNAPASRRCRVP